MYYQKQLCLQSAIGAASAPLDKDYLHTHYTQLNYIVPQVHCILVNYIAQQYVVRHSSLLALLYYTV